MFKFIFVIVCLITVFAMIIYRWCRYFTKIVLPYRRIKKNSKEIEGVVVDFANTYNYKGFILRTKPIVEFTVYNRIVRAITIFSTTTHIDEIEKDTKITVIYNELNSSEAFVKNTVSSDLAGILIFLFVFFSIFFIVLFLFIMSFIFKVLMVNQVI